MRLIDAGALKEQMESVCMGIMAGTDSYNAPLKTIDDAPTIDPVNHGEWNETGDRGGRNYACGCCRFTFIVDTCMGEPMWNYCPNCGAKMDGGEG